MSFLGSALGSVIGGLFGLAGGSMQQSSAMAQTERAAQLQRENWEYAQKNAHQFEIEDLKAAGLNPILSANHSQLASMPSVATPQGPSAYGNLGSNVTAAITSALENDRKKDELEIQRRRLKLDEAKNAAEIEYLEKQRDKLDNDISVSLADLDIRKRLASADLDVKKQAAYELAAKAGEAISHSGLYETEKHKLMQQMKYGVLIASYLPEEAREFAYSNIATWVHDHEDEIKTFIERGGLQLNSEDAHALARSLFEYIDDSLHGRR